MHTVATVRIWAPSEDDARHQFTARGLVSETEPTQLDIPARNGAFPFEFVVAVRRDD